MTKASAIEETSTLGVAFAVIDYIDSLKNSEVDHKSLSEIHHLLGLLFDHCNLLFLRPEFQIELVEAPIETCQPDMDNWYLFCRPFEMKKFITGAFEALERLSNPDRIHTSNRSIEVLSVIIDCVNLVLFRSTKFGLKIEEKKQLDDLSNSSSNKLLAISTHFTNGDDNHG